MQSLQSVMQAATGPFGGWWASVYAAVVAHMSVFVYTALQQPIINLSSSLTSCFSPSYAHLTHP